MFFFLFCVGSRSLSFFNVSFLFTVFKIFYLFIFREREGREKERERNIDVPEIHR